MLLALPLTSLALRFGPPEFFALIVLGLSLVTGLASSSLVRALISAFLGLLIAMVGIDPVMGAPASRSAPWQLMDGVALVPVAMGLFGVSEILLNARAERRAPGACRAVRSLMPSARGPRALMSADRCAAPASVSSSASFPGVGAVVPTLIVLRRREARLDARRKSSAPA